MIEYWIGWSHRSGDGHHDAQATPCRSPEERELRLTHEDTWPPHHAPHNTWQTRDGIVL